MGRIITITSGKGGVGKTTITANIGTSLALLGHSVCIIDADIGLQNLDIPLGLTNRIVYDIFDYANGKCELKHILIKDKRLSNLVFLPGSKNYSTFDLPSQLFKQMTKELSKNFEFVLIDSPAGIEYGFKNAIYASNEAIVVAIPDRTSIQDADRAIGIIEQTHSVEPLLILNMLKEKSHERLNSDGNQYMFSNLHLDVLGEIYEDRAIILSVHNGVPIALDNTQETGLRFRQMARNLINHTFSPFVPIKKVEKRKWYSLLNRTSCKIKRM